VAWESPIKWFHIQRKARRIKAIHIAAAFTVKMGVGMMAVVGGQAIKKRSAATAEPINQPI